MHIFHIILFIAVALYIIFIIKLIFNIIMTYDNCNPIKTVGWIFAVVFSGNRRDRIYCGRKKSPGKSSLFELLRNNIRQRKQKPSFGFKIEEHATSAKQNKELKILLSHLSQLPIFPGNQVDFFYKWA